MCSIGSGDSNIKLRRITIQTWITRVVNPDDISTGDRSLIIKIRCIGGAIRQDIEFLIIKKDVGMDTVNPDFIRFASGEAHLELKIIGGFAREFVRLPGKQNTDGRRITGSRGEGVCGSRGWHEGLRDRQFWEDR